MSTPIHVNGSANLPAGLNSESRPRGLTRADLLTAAQVADLLGVPVSTVREWGRNGTLPRIKLGRHVRFLRTQVEATILSARDVGDP
jgi:excisionase family DNA binding protein